MLKRNIKESDEEYCRARGLPLLPSIDSSLEFSENENKNESEVISEHGADDIEKDQDQLVDVIKIDNVKTCETDCTADDEHVADEQGEGDAGLETENKHQAYEYDINHDYEDETHTYDHGTNKLSGNIISVKVQRIKLIESMFPGYKYPKAEYVILLERLRKRAFDLQDDGKRKKVILFQHVYTSLESFNLSLLLSCRTINPKRIAIFISPGQR